MHNYLGLTPTELSMTLSKPDLAEKHGNYFTTHTQTSLPIYPCTFLVYNLSPKAKPHEV